MRLLQTKREELGHSPSLPAPAGNGASPYLRPEKALQTPTDEPEKKLSLDVESDEQTPVALPDSLLTRTDDYDPALADAAVGARILIVDKRFWEVVCSLLSFFVVSFMTTMFPEKKLSAEQRRRYRAQTIKELLFDLGPTFIKLGQFMSVRRDVLPLEIAEELALLQDKVPPFGLDLVRRTIKDDLGRSPEELFLHFEPMPLASASIGQVHRVQLADGRWAVIKVQRPDLAREFYRDLGLMRLIANWWIKLEHLKQRIQRKPSATSEALQGWLNLSDEFGRTLFCEIDYLREGRNADRLRRILRSKPRVRVPRVIWKYTGRHVLTLEYIGGTKISQAQKLKDMGFDLNDIGSRLVNCYLEQFVLTGFFHADPHAGNLAVDDFGNLIIYDFGMMGEITEAQRKSLLYCVMAVVRREPEQVTKSLMELGIVSPNATAEVVSRAIGPFIDYYAGRDIMNLDFQHLEQDVDKVIAERSFRLPANLAYLLRAGSSLEGIARTLKPDFNFADAVKPVMTKWALQQGIETLAKNGKLLEFAGLAFSEISRAMSSGNTVNANEAKTPSNAIKNNKSQKAASKPSISGYEPAKVSNAEKHPGIPTLVNCTRCSEQSKEVRALHKRLKGALLLGIPLITVLVGESVCFFLAASPDYRQLSLYFLIGNSVLGAIIFWKLIHLSKK